MTNDVMLEKNKLLIGWQEWCALQELGIPAIKAKIDTGAKTSALHASAITTYHRNHRLYVEFIVHPLQKNQQFNCVCQALVIDQRHIMSSNGIKEHRYIIRTLITLGNLTWEIDISLSNRDPMRFRMLLGRDAIRKHTIIDPMYTLCQGKITRKQLKKYYPINH